MADETHLMQDVGLSRQQVLDNEPIDFDVVEKPKREKREMYLKEDVDLFVASAMADLRDAYQNIDEKAENEQSLQTQLQQSQQSLSDANQKLTANQTQLKKVQQTAAVTQKDEDTLSASEKILNEVEEIVSRFKQRRQQDEARLDEDVKTIQKLKQDLENVSSDNNQKQTSLQAEQQKVVELQNQIDNYKRDYQGLADDVNAVLDALQSQFSDLTAPNDNPA